MRQSCTSPHSRSGSDILGWPVAPRTGRMVSLTENAHNGVGVEVELLIILYTYAHIYLPDVAVEGCAAVIAHLASLEKRQENRHSTPLSPSTSTICRSRRARCKRLRTLLYIVLEPGAGANDIVITAAPDAITGVSDAEEGSFAANSTTVTQQ